MKIKKVLLITLLIIFAIFNFFISLYCILNFIFPKKDGYLLTGLSFYMLFSLIFIIPTIILFIYKKKDIIKIFKINKVVFICMFVFVILFESIFVIASYTYYKDVVEGPKEEIMTNAVIKRIHTGKSGTNDYLYGYINGKKIKLSVTRDARFKLSRNVIYKKIKVKYYKNIKEVFKIELIVNYYIN